MTEKTDYTKWSSEEIQRQIQTLSSTSDLAYRRENYLIELGDGFLRYAEMQDDKSWSDWKRVETPNLHVTEGKIVTEGESYLIIRVSSDEAYQLCTTKDEPWSDNQAENCFNMSSEGIVLDYMLSHGLEKTDLLTTRTTPPGIPIQVELSTKMELYLSDKYYNNVKKMYEDADLEYQTDGWIKYFPYEESSRLWVPKQEVYYLNSLLRSREKAEKRKTKKLERPVVNTTHEESINIKEEYTSGKSYLIAAILAILVGGIGAHKFYMGKYLKGILYLLFCWTYIPSIIGIIEGIQYFIGGQEKFDERLL